MTATRQPRPPREPMWTCGICSTENEPSRSTCRNASDPAKHPAVSD